MSQVEDEDQACIAKVLLGDTEAFSPLVQKYHPRIIAFCCDLLGDRARAEDAAQEVFLKAFSKLNAFRGDASFRGWLYRIARNHCFDLLRKAKRRGEISTEDAAGEESAELSRKSQSADAAYARLAASDLLQQVLSALSVGHKEVLLLREYYALSYEEIADVLEVTVDAVKGRLKRARIEVQEVMRHLEQDSDVTTERGI